MARPISDIAGQRFGNLEVLCFAEMRNGNSYWLCRCSCGVEKPIILSALRRGQDSCGCVGKERQRASVLMHGKSKTAEFGIWVSMIQRCTNPKAISYRLYGARGIRVCAEWLASFEAFYADMGPRPSEEYSIDRIDGDGNYEPLNCRWATHTEQMRNRRDVRKFEFNGESRCIAEWAEVRGIPKTTLNNRMRRGWSIERALTTPPANYRREG